MQIKCWSLDRFLDVIAGLVERGICFEADAQDFVVSTTGGF